MITKQFNIGRAWLGWSFFALLLAGLLALAGGSAQAADDPPARAGRVSEISGDAWIFDAERRDWERLERNRTITEGDRLRSDGGASHITLRIGSTTLWLDERSELEFERLDDERVLLRVERGSVALRLRSREQAQDYRLQTREGRAFPDGEGLFRVDQLERGSRAIAWQGRLRFEFRAAETEPVWLNAGEQAEFWTSQQGPRTERQSIERDAFARWLKDQREAEGEIQAYRYVSPEMTGAEDLDRYGRWDNSPEYGAIWVPLQVSVGWEPYRYGRWAWSVRWGWTWVDEAPWGFAPFHYGRWVIIGGRWCWAPGRYVARPVYAPALVSWSVNINIGGGSRPPPPRPGVWAPLPPHQVYTPVYRHTPVYRDRLNRDHDPQPPRQVERPGRPPRDDNNPGHGQQPGSPGSGDGAAGGIQRPQPPVVTPPQRPNPPQQGGRDDDRRPQQPGRGERPDAGQGGAAGAGGSGGSTRPNGSFDGAGSTPSYAPGSQPVQPSQRGGSSGSERPAQDRPGERAFERPVERQIERPVDRAVERPAERQIERQTERQTERPNGSFVPPAAVQQPARPVERAVEAPRAVAPVAAPAPVRAAPAAPERPRVSEERGQPEAKRGEPRGRGEGKPRGEQEK